ncbi:MAG: hypothetical protein ACREAQ_09585, partial [Nitrososphaera sp.]
QETMRFSQDLILSGFILNVLATKNGALLVNSPDTPSKARIDLIRPYIQGELLKNLRIFSHEKVASYPIVIVLSDDEKENQERLTKEYENLRGLSKKGSGQVVVALDVGLNEIRRFEEADLWKSRLIDLARIIRENGDLLVLVNRTGLDTVPLPKTISDIHLQILNKSGIHFVRVQKPSIDGPTILFSLSADDRKRYPAYILKKVV